MYKLTQQEMMAVSGGTCGYVSVPVYNAYGAIIGWQNVYQCWGSGGGGGGSGGCWQDSYNVLHC